MTDDIPAPPPARSETLFRVFRLVAVIEGLTTLALFFVAMPIKYVLGDPLWVQITGPVHGYAFLAYLGLMTAALWGRGWTAADWGRTIAAAFLPLGTFLNDPFLMRRKAAEAPDAIL
ncbi:MAG: DUF3817 domain-containing protein [Sphingomonadales bacterium]|nr:DUF3817 domain-containing protein [Sphingomonadales bacterium]